MHLWAAEPGGGAGGDIPCSVTCATNIWGCMYDVYIALMKMFSLQKGRHVSCLSCLPNILTSNSQCMRMSPTLGLTEGNQIPAAREGSNTGRFTRKFHNDPVALTVTRGHFLVHIKHAFPLKIPQSQGLWTYSLAQVTLHWAKETTSNTVLFICFIFYLFCSFVFWDLNISLET